MEKKKIRARLPQTLYWTIFFALVALCDCLFISGAAYAIAFALIFLWAYLPPAVLPAGSASTFVCLFFMCTLVIWGWRSTLFISRTLKDASVKVVACFVLVTTLFLLGLAIAIANVEFFPPQGNWNSGVRLCLPGFYAVDETFPEVGIAVSNKLLGAAVFAGAISRFFTGLAICRHKSAAVAAVQN